MSKHYVLRHKTVLIVLAVGFFLMFFLGILVFQAPTGNVEFARKSQAKNDVTQIAVAVTAFETEYGHLPPVPSNGTVSGELAAALLGNNDTVNPRKIVFIEIGTAKKNSKSGLRADGIFVDPWGSPYQLAVASGTNNQVLAGTNHTELLRKRVAVWNDASLNPDAASISDAKKNRRYVKSWD